MNCRTDQLITYLLKGSNKRYLLAYHNTDTWTSIVNEADIIGFQIGVPLNEWPQLRQAQESASNIWDVIRLFRALFISKVSRGQVPLTCSKANNKIFLREVTHIMTYHLYIWQKEGIEIVFADDSTVGCGWNNWLEDDWNCSILFLNWMLGSQSGIMFWSVYQRPLNPISKLFLFPDTINELLKLYPRNGVDKFILNDQLSMTKSFLQSC